MLYVDAHKYPVSKEIVQEATRLKDLALHETHTYDGWNPAKLELRLMIGYTAECWIADRLRKEHGLIVEHPDPSGPQGDEYDLKIGRILVDVKTTCTFDIPPRVNSSRTESIHVDWYIFTRVDIRFKWLQILGVAPRGMVARPENLVGHGKMIPGTRKAEFFRHGSYYPPSLLEWEKFLEVFK